MMWWLLGIFLVLSIAIIAIYHAVKFGLIILKVQDTVEDALDVLDERYYSINKIMETPLFYDSPEIRRVLKDITVTRDSILAIAQSLTNLEIETEDIVDDSQDEDLD
jgi:hypothetical protein